MDYATTITRVITESRELVRALQWAVWRQQLLITQRHKTMEQLAAGVEQISIKSDHPP